MKTYTELKNRQAKEFDAFPIAYAFSEKQLQEALIKLTATKEDCCTVGGGSIVKKIDVKSFLIMQNTHEKERKQAFLVDDILIGAIKYELGNHEYGYTRDATDTINALGIDLSDKRVNACFKQAKSQYLEDNKDNF